MSDRKIVRGSTSQSWWVKFLDTDGNLVTGKTHSDITSMGFRRYNGGQEVTEIASTTPASLANKASAYSAGGFVEDSDSPGRYRYDPVNAAFETGADSADNVEPILACSGVSSIVFERVLLVDFDPFATAQRQLEDDAIQDSKFDEVTAFPLKQNDSGNSSILRRGASAIDATDLETQIDLAQNDLDNITDNGVDLVDAPNSNAVTAIQSGLGTSAGQAAIQSTQASHTSTLTSIVNAITEIPANVWNRLTSVITTDGSIGKHLLDQFTAVLSAIAGIEGGEGSGANVLTTIVQDADEEPLERINVRVKLNADSRRRETPANGRRTFNVDNGTWTIICEEPGYYLSGASGTGVSYDSETETASVVVTGDVEVTLTLTTYVINVSETPGTITGTLITLGNTNSPESGIDVHYAMVTDPDGSTGFVFGQGEEQIVTSVAGGLAEFVGLAKGAKYTFWSGSRKFAKTLTIPTETGEAESVKLGSLRGN